MNRYILQFGLLCILYLFSSSLNAQAKEQIIWKDFCDSTFVFEISNKEAEKFIKQWKDEKLMKELLHSHVATFKHVWTNSPKQGHFIYANIHKNKIDYSYAPIMPFQVFLFKEYGLLTLQVIDASGEIRDDAKIKIQGGKWRLFDDGVNYDAESKTYTLNDSWSDNPRRILTVELDKFKAVFDLNKHIVQPWHGRNYYNSSNAPSVYSYMLTDKNKYKPHEKIRFKTYALKGNRKPIKEDLEVWIQTPSYSYKKIGTVAPYNPGGFAGEIQLHDSLQLKLDQYYNIRLIDKNKQVIANTSIKYEDYELHDAKIETKLKNWIHYYPTVNEVEIKVMDSNNMPLLDQKAVITIKKGTINKSYVELLVSYSDVLTETISLNNEGITTYNIPPQLFKDVDCNYNISIECLTPDGQKLKSEHNAFFYTSNYSIKETMKGSTMQFAFYVLGKEENTDAKLYIDNDEPIDIQLPYVQEFNQSVKTYRVLDPKSMAERTVYTADIDPNLKIEGGIIKDSLILNLENPLELDLSWYIYEGNQLLEKGAGKELSFEKAYIDLDLTYYLEIFYSMGGEEHIFRKQYIPKKEYLSIDLDMPNRIYPGQTLESKIKVTDSRGKGLKDVDLTAFAYNSQLNYQVPDLPYYGNTPKGREQRDSYSINKRDVSSSAMLTQKNFNFWNRIAHLDQMEYYQFIFPNPSSHDSIAYSPSQVTSYLNIPYHDVFKYTIDTPEGTTEFAPYVMQNGQAVNIYAIELDNKPIYFSWTQQPKAYSFLTDSENYHNIMLRLADRAIIIDNYCFDKGKKTILSIDLNKMPKSKHVRTISIYEKDKYGRNILTAEEIKRYKSTISKIPITNDRYTYLVKNNEQIPIHHPNWARTQRTENLVGPLDNGQYQYMDGIKYYHEGGFAHQYRENVVYKYPLNIFPDEYLKYTFSNDFRELNDFYLSEKEFNKRISYQHFKVWRPTEISLTGTKIHVPVATNDSIGVHSLVMQSSKTGKLFRPVYRGQILYSERTYTQYGYRPATLYGIDGMEYGDYNIILLYDDGNYLRYDSVPLLMNAYTELKMNKCVVHPKDSLSAKWLDYELYATKDISYRDYVPDNTFQYRHSKRFNAANDVQGTILDETGEPLIGVSIYIKETKIGTVSDIDGKFIIDLHGTNNTLVFSYIGYKKKEIEVTRGNTIEVLLAPDNQLLEEVIVVGYGRMQKQNLTGSVAGLTTSTVSSTNPIVPEEKLEDTETNETTDEAEANLYQELLQLDGMRSNFSDVGFWQPALVTNRKGEADFTVTFPDNITRWEAVVYAMNRKLKTGTLRKSIRSYKPLMAELKTPSFLVEGDESNFIAHIRNYTKDKQIEGKVNFVQAGDTLINNRTTLFDASYVDKLLVKALDADSLTTSYRFTRNDGYSDGEQRTIPIEKQGVRMAEGTLQFLRNGDNISASAQSGEEVFITITGKPIDIYMNATYYLTGYKYACNEQLASKLMGLLNYKLYQQYNNKEFKHDKQVNQIIDRLVDNQNSAKLWSWWGNNSSTSYWMSAHILKALAMAKKAGYKVSLDIKNTEHDYIDIHRFRGTSLNDINILSALVDWGTEQSYKEIIELFEERIATIEAKEDSLVKIYKKTGLRKDYAIRYSYMRDKLLLQEMRQKLGLEYDRSIITDNLKTDILGGVRLVDSLSNRYWYYNNDAANIVAYNIIKRDSVLNKYVDGMQMSILGTKRYGWNTYQASNAVSAILPDLLAESASKDQLAKVKLSGDDNRTLTEFPFATVLTDGKTINIKKESGMPLIYSAYKIERRSKEKFGDAFEIKTSINQDKLVKGIPVAITVEVKVKQENAEHVIIEVPIPAGCSYESKHQRGYWGYEVHREHFKEKVSIFCEKLPEGTHTFTIDLLPRYTGNYTLNPAKVEMMYFPVVNANNDMRKVEIGE